MTDKKCTYKDLDAEIVFKKLLNYGLFPSSLSEIFSSESFGDLILSGGSSKEAFDLALESYKEVLKDPTKKSKKKKKVFHSFSILPFSLTRNTNVSRGLGIPHPLAYYYLSKSIYENWDKIDEAIGNNNPGYLDASMIVPSNKDRLINSLYEESEIFEERLTHIKLSSGEKRVRSGVIFKKQFGAKYVVEADISGFFSNIYSHSIPWALLGKNKVKNIFQNLNNEFPEEDKWADDLDKRSSEMKNQETNGVPIGPDSSNILSEIILSQVDKELLFKGYSYIRYVDDYYCFCKTEDETKSFLKDLEQELSTYNLELNSNKTKVHSLPRYETNSAIRQIRNYKIPKLIGPHNFQQVLDFLDLAVELSKKQKDYSPFKYAIKKCSNNNVKYESYEVFEIIFLYISNIVFSYPYLIASFYSLLEFSANSKEEGKGNVKEFLDKLLLEHIPYRRSDVITLSIFFAIKLDIQLKDFERISKLVLDLNDPIPALLCFLYAQKNNLGTDMFFDKITEVDQKEWWLYIYELLRIDDEKVLANISGKLLYKDFYEWLINHHVSFLKIRQV